MKIKTKASKEEMTLEERMAITLPIHKTVREWGVPITNVFVMEDGHTIHIMFNWPNEADKGEKILKDHGVSIKEKKTIIGGTYIEVDKDQFNGTKSAKEAVSGRAFVPFHGRQYPVKPESFLNGKLASYANEMGLELLGTVTFKDGDKYKIYDSGFGNIRSGNMCAVKVNEASAKEAISFDAPDGVEYGRLMGEIKEKFRKENQGWRIRHNNVGWLGYTLTSPTGQEFTVHTPSGFPVDVYHYEESRYSGSIPAGKKIIQFPRWTNTDVIIAYLMENGLAGKYQGQGQILWCIASGSMSSWHPGRSMRLCYYGGKLIIRDHSSTGSTVWFKTKQEAQNFLTAMKQNPKRTGNYKVEYVERKTPLDLKPVYFPEGKAWMAKDNSTTVAKESVGRTDLAPGTRVKGKTVDGRELTGTVEGPGYWEGAVRIYVDNPPKVPRRSSKNLHINDDDFAKMRKNAASKKIAIITDVVKI